MHTRTILFMLCIFLAVRPASAQTVWHVDDDNCPGPGSGTEADPFCMIQDCIDAAMDGDDCVVAPGTYFENINLLGKAITLRSTNGPDVTTIDANGSGTVVKCISDEGADTVLDGFTITHGNAVSGGGGMLNINSSPTVTNCTFSENIAVTGGAMYNRANEPALTNNIFKNNMATDRGGAMYNLSAGDLTIHDCVFEGNSAQFGGAIYNLSGSSIVLAGCTFERNTAALDGGGVYNRSGSNPTVSDCAFRINTAENGGGMANESGGNPTVIHCVFEGNIATGHGGGMINSFESTPVIVGCLFSENSAKLCGGGIHNMSNNQDRPKVIGCRFVANTAQHGGGICNLGSRLWAIDSEFIDNTAMLGSGGGMFSDYSFLFVANCTFRGNAATDTESTAHNGGLPGLPGRLAVANRAPRAATVTTGLGGGMSHLSGTLVMTTSLFSLNSATGGGGMYDATFLAIITNSTFAGNSATTLGGGIYVEYGSSDSLVSNCIVWDNAAAEGAEIYHAGFGLLTIRYSDVAGGQGGVQGPGPLLWEEGNIEADPLFFDPARANYRLSVNSPCIDSGDNTVLPSDPADSDGDGDTDEPSPHDLDGNPRFVDDPNTDDTGLGDPPIVDMGAYEFRDPCADDDGDGRVTICHLPPGNRSNAQTIIINIKALPAHLAHGDHCGPCEDGGD